jgi:signal recognition particle receptor subunit beta
MTLINSATRELHYTVVYYGASASGKTTNLRFIQQRAMPREPHALRSWADQDGRTAFFDQVSLPFGVQHGLRTMIHLLAVPGATMYTHTRTALLANVDGVVFVADARPAARAANQARWHELHAALNEHRRSSVPIVLQHNHTDAADALDASALQEMFGNNHVHIAANAATGVGVLATLQTLGNQLFATLH